MKYLTRRGHWANWGESPQALKSKNLLESTEGLVEGQDFVRYRDVIMFRIPEGKTWFRNWVLKNGKPTRRYYLPTKCSQCSGIAFKSLTTPKMKNTFCSMKCRDAFFVRERHANWSSGETITRGRKMVRIILENGGLDWVYEHQVIAAKMLSRKLMAGEVVHHIDCNPLNNNPSNLDVMDAGQHTSAHFSLNKLAAKLLQKGIIIYDKINKRYSISNSIA